MTDLVQTAGAQTLAEIRSEPQTWKECFAALESDGILQRIRASFNSPGELVFIGCGSSYYLASVAAATWSLLVGEAARAVPASEILLFPKLLPRACRAVLISRSGHTSEVLRAGRYLAQERQKAALAITCGIGTPLEGLAEQVVRLPHADEKSMVMTRSFSSMLLALQWMATECGPRGEFAQGIRALPRAVEPQMHAIDSTIRRLASGRVFADYVFLGQGPFYGIAQEAMLKVKEMSCSYGQCFHTLEFRHGPKAIVSPDTLVTFFLSESGYESEVAVLKEIKELGGATLAVTNRVDAAVRECADALVELSLEVPEAVRAAAAVIPAQFLGFYTGLRKGLDPDSPRNLSRVVKLNHSADGDSARGGA